MTRKNELKSFFTRRDGDRIWQAGGYVAGIEVAAINIEVEARKALSKRHTTLAAELYTEVAKEYRDAEREAGRYGNEREVSIAKRMFILAANEAERKAQSLEKNPSSVEDIIREHIETYR